VCELRKCSKAIDVHPLRPPVRAAERGGVLPDRTAPLMSRSSALKAISSRGCDEDDPE